MPDQRQRSRTPRFEQHEPRVMLTVDLVVEIDELEPPGEISPGDEVTRIVRLYNNGDETADDAVIRAAFPDLDEITWERNSGFAQYLATARELREPDVVIEGYVRGANLIGDLDNDGRMEFSVTTDDGKFLLAGPPTNSGPMQLSVEDGIPNANEITLLGDINADGINDVAVNNRVVFGRDDLQLTELTMAQFEPDPGHGFAIGDDLLHIEHIGDVNADGIDDVFVNKNVYGRDEMLVDGIWVPRERLSAIIYGAPDIGATGELSIEAITATGEQSIASVLPFLANSVTEVGDLNGDGFAEFAFENPANAEHSARVVLGGPDIVSQEDWEPHFFNVEHMLETGYTFGPFTSLRAAGDINRDGVNDLLIQIAGAQCNFCTSSEKEISRTESGVAIVFGRTDIGDASSINEESPGVVTFGMSTPQLASGVGAWTEDLNADGHPDIAFASNGQQYVVFTDDSLESVHFGRVEDRYVQFNGVDGYTGVPDPSYIVDTNRDSDPEWWRRRNVHMGTETMYYRDVWLSDPFVSVPSHGDAIATGDGELVDVVDIPAGQSMIYRVTGLHREPAEPTESPFATVASGQFETDLRDNVFPQFDASLFSVEPVSGIRPDGDATVRVVVKNAGPATGTFRVSESITTELPDVAWTTESRPFPEWLHMDDWRRAHGPMFSLEHFTQVLTIGDINGDGYPEVMLPSPTILFGDADFGSDATPEVVSLVHSDSHWFISGTIPLEDIDGDGMDDLLLTTIGQVDRDSPRVTAFYILYGRSDISEVESIDINPTLTSLMSEPDTQNGIYASMGDINGDGQPDFHVASGSSYSASLFLSSPGYGLAQWLQEGAPNNRLLTFTNGLRRSVGITGVGDVNGDGIQDLTIVHNDSPGELILGSDDLLPGTLDAGRLRGVRLQGERDWSVRLLQGEHDLNGDGFIDLVALARNGEETRRAVVYGPVDLTSRRLRINNDVPLPSFETETYGLAHGDFNGDDYEDLAITLSPHESTILHGNPDGYSDRPFRLGSTPSGLVGGLYSYEGLWFLPGVDMNGDGADELIIRNFSYGEYNFDGARPGSINFLMGRPAVSASGTGPIQGTFEVPAGGEIVFEFSGRVPTTLNDAYFEVIPEGLDLDPLPVRVDVHPLPPADVNGDGGLDLADALVMAKWFGATDATFAQGDINEDGIVDFDDFLTLSAAIAEG